MGTTDTKHKNNLSTLRISKDQNVKTLTALLDVSKSTYYKIENGEAALTLKQATDLAEKYETTIDYILGRADIPDRICDIRRDIEKILASEKDYNRQLKSLLEDWDEKAKPTFGYDGIPNKEKYKWRMRLRIYIGEEKQGEWSINRKIRRKIAEKAGINISTLNNYLDDRYNNRSINMETFSNLVEKLGLSLDFLIPPEPTADKRPSLAAISNSFAELSKKDEQAAERFKQFVAFLSSYKNYESINTGGITANDNLPERLKKLRLANPYIKTQTALSKLTADDYDPDYDLECDSDERPKPKVSQKTIWNIENDRYKKNDPDKEIDPGSGPSINNIAHLALALDVSIDYLLGRVNTPIRISEFDRFYYDYCLLNNTDKIRLHSFIEYINRRNNSHEI